MRQFEPLELDEGRRPPPPPHHVRTSISFPREAQEAEGLILGGREGQEGQEGQQPGKQEQEEQVLVLVVLVLVGEFEVVVVKLGLVQGEGKEER